MRPVRCMLTMEGVCLAHVQLALSCSRGFFLICGLWGYGRYYQFGDGCLEFYIVRTGITCHLYHPAGHLFVAVVVDTGFGNYDCMVRGSFLCNVVGEKYYFLHISAYFSACNPVAGGYRCKALAF